MEDYKKKYEDAFEKCKKEFNFSNLAYSHEEIKQKLLHIFPEFKESEDEKIRNFITNELACLRAIDEKGSDRYNELTEAIDWLEMQGEHQQFLNKIQVGDELTKNERGQLVNLSQLERVAKPRNKQKDEQKPADKVEPKFKVGDFIINEYGFIMQIDEIDGNMYGYHVLDGNTLLKHDIIKTEESCHLWTIKDVKDGDVLAVEPIYEYTSPLIAIYKECDLNSFISYCFIDFNGIFNKGTRGHSTNLIHLATKEQRNILFQKMHKAGYEWDAEKKELKKIEQKPVKWSEEDEHRVKDTIYFLDTAKKHYTSVIELDACIDWLKSLKQRMKGQ